MASSIGHVTMPFDGMVSAAVYDDQGQFIKSLLQGSQQRLGVGVDLQWDGTDQFGQPVPNQRQYEWRAAFSRVKGVFEGDVGDSGSPSYGASEANGNVNGVATDQAGNVYSISYWEEAHKELRKYGPDGRTLWYINRVGGYGGIATDGQYVYVSIDYREGGREDRVYRYSAADGSAAPFPGSGQPYITVIPNRTALPVEYESQPLRGLAVDSSRLFVGDYLNDRVAVYDKATGVLLTSLPMADPLGLAIAAEPSGSTPGSLWAVNGAGTVSEFDYTVDGGDVRFAETGGRITGLDSPYALAVGGAARHLFVLQRGRTFTGVREYDISGASPVTAGLGALGSLASPGPVSDSGFRGPKGLAVAPDGTMVVADSGNQRVQTFTAGGRLLRSEYSEFISQPFADKFAQDGSHALLSGGWEYQVAATPQPGWMGDGRWRLASNWQPADDRFFSQISVRRSFLVNNTLRDYIFYIGGKYKGVAVYQVDADGRGMRRSAIVGTNWIGATGDAPDSLGRWTWADGDADGRIADGEVTWNLPAGVRSAVNVREPGYWVDDAGSIWVADLAGEAVKLPLLGFDASGNPLYDWARRQAVFDTLGTTPRSIRVASSGEIMVSGGPSMFVNGGHIVSRYDAAGRRVSAFAIPGVEDAAGIAVSPDGNYWFAGLNSPGFGYNTGGRHEGTGNWIDLYTRDNLRIATIKSDPRTDGEVGWFDAEMPLNAYTANGRLYVYGEEVLYGKASRYRVDNLESVQRTGRTFSWPDSPTIVEVTATSPEASETGGLAGVFTVTRNNTAGPLTVYYTVGGSASPADYQGELVSAPSYRQDFDAMSPGPIRGQDSWVGEAWHVVQGDVSRSGNALLVGSGSGVAAKKGIFAPSAASPVQRLSFDFRLAADIRDFAGTPGVDIQNAIMMVRGPDALAANEFQLVYKAYTGPSGEIGQDQLQLRGASGLAAMTGLRKGFWYHVEMRLDFARGAASVQVLRDGVPLWSSGEVRGYATGNTNAILTGATAKVNAPFYLDNIQAAWNAAPLGMGIVTIPDGATSATIVVAPSADGLDEGQEAMTLRLAADNAYALGYRREAGIRIWDRDPAARSPLPVNDPGPAPPAQVVSITATDGAEGGGRGSFTITRTNPVGPLRVDYVVAGTAGVEDYRTPLVYRPIYANAFDALPSGSLNGRDGWVASPSVTVQPGGEAGGQAVLVSGTASKKGIFAPASVSPRQRLGFDFRLGSSILSYAGRPWVDLQQGLMEIRGPVANQRNWFAFYYKGATDGAGRPGVNYLYLMGDGAPVAYAAPDPDAWYHADVDLDFAAGTAVVTLSRGGSVVWTSPAVRGRDNGNINALVLASDTAPAVPFSLDNVSVAVPASYGFGSVVIPDGQLSVTLDLTAVDDALAEGDESVLVSLAGSPRYATGPDSNAVALIRDNDRFVVGIAANGTTSAASAAPGSFTITRNSTAGDLAVRYSVGGDAAPGSYLEPIGSVFKQTFEGTSPGPINGLGTWYGSWADVVQPSSSGSGRSLLVNRSVINKYPFKSSREAPVQVLKFDFRMTTDIYDFAGTPGVDIQNSIMQVRGPDANAANEFFLVYKAWTDVYGRVARSSLELRGVDRILTMPDLRKGRWYHVELRLDFARGACSAEVNTEGATPWSSGGEVRGYNNGNFNMIIMSADQTPIAPFEVDDIIVDESPSRGGVAIIPEGQSSVTIWVTPVAGQEQLRGSSLTLSLLGDAGYDVGPSGVATAPLGTALVPSDPTAAVGDAAEHRAAPPAALAAEFGSSPSAESWSPPAEAPTFQPKVADAGTAAPTAGSPPAPEVTTIGPVPDATAGASTAELAAMPAAAAATPKAPPAVAPFVPPSPVKLPARWRQQHRRHRHPTPSVGSRATTLAPRPNARVASPVLRWAPGNPAGRKTDDRRTH